MDTTRRRRLANEERCASLACRAHHISCRAHIQCQDRAAVQARNRQVSTHAGHLPQHSSPQAPVSFDVLGKGSACVCMHGGQQARAAGSDTPLLPPISIRSCSQGKSRFDNIRRKSRLLHHNFGASARQKRGFSAPTMHTNAALTFARTHLLSVGGDLLIPPYPVRGAACAVPVDFTIVRFQIPSLRRRLPRRAVPKTARLACQCGLQGGAMHGGIQSTCMNTVDEQAVKAALHNVACGSGSSHPCPGPPGGGGGRPADLVWAAALRVKLGTCQRQTNLVTHIRVAVSLGCREV